MSRPWMPLYVGDYLVDTLDLRAEESGVYLLMLMLAWRRPDGAIPNDMKWLQRALASCASDMHGNRFNRLVPPLLDRFFVLGEDGKFRNKRLTKEREKAEKFSGKQKENAEKRWGAVNENNNLTDASAMPAHAKQSQSQSQSHIKKDPPLRVVDGWPENFGDLFWEAYPKKTEKISAMKKLAIVRKSGIVTFIDLMAGVKRYANAVTNSDPKYTKHPTSWLNAGCWADETQPGGGNGARDFNAKRGSASSDFFAGMRGLAADIAGDDQSSGDADAEIPVGRVNIEH